MDKFVILFRGINVGGNNLLSMKEFITKLKANNFESIDLYIQSGNIVLKSMNDPTAKIQSIVSDNFGFKPEIFTLNETEFSEAYTNNPYTVGEGKFIHFYFCKNNIELNQDSIDKFIVDSEQYSVKGNIFYLFAPYGIGRSKLVANIERCLGQNTTGRNLNTVNKINSMLKGI